MVEYDNVSVCIKCGHQNDVIVTDTINNDVCEAATVCTKCGHTDYWAYGFYESNTRTARK